MELVSTMEISGEEREIADAYARGQCATNAQNIATNTEGIAGLNNNLSQLEYSDVAGGKNIINIQNPISITAIWYKSFRFKCEKNTTYILSLTVDSYTVGVNAAIVTKSLTQLGPFLHNNKITFDSGDNEELYLRLYSGNGTSGTTVYSNVQIEKGTQATSYEPYIPSVKMLAEDVSAQNNSLEDYGLDNVYDGVAEAGYISSDGTITSSNACVYSSFFNAKAGDRITIKYDGNFDDAYGIVVGFYDSNNTFISRTIGGASKKVTIVAPTNTAKFRFSVDGSSNTAIITPQNVAKITVYINNAIDVLKNDLSKQCKKDDITTNETLIGTFNGKNYYRKLFTGISGSGGSVTVNVGGKIEIYNYYGRAYMYGQSGASDVKYPIPNKNYYIESQSISETSFQLAMPTSSDMRKIDLVIEYTKVDE